MSTLCRCGLHKWSPWGDVVLNNDGIFVQFRWCYRCRIGEWRKL